MYDGHQFAIAVRCNLIHLKRQMKQFILKYLYLHYAGNYNIQNSVVKLLMKF